MFTCFSCYSLQLVFSCSSAGSNAVFIPSSIGKTGYSTISTINSYGMSSTNCYAILQGDTIICYISFIISSCIKIKVAIYRYTCAFSIYGINCVSVGCGCFNYRSDVGTLNYLCLSSCTYLIQLAYVYSVIISNTICYIMNLLTAHAYIVRAQYNTSITSTDCKTIGIYNCIASFYAVYGQVFLQCQTSCSNLKVLFIFLQLHRNCICLINSNTITFSIFSIGICNNSCLAINSNGSSFIILCNTYFRTGFNSIILTIDFNACCSIFTTNSLYLRTGSKCLLSFTIRNLNKSIIICTTAVSTATAGNGNSTINCLTAISYQADNCRIGIFSQSNFFNNVFIQILDILIYHSQITVILANRIGFHSSTGICNASCPITIELTIILYCHKNFIIFAINSAGINIAAISISKHAQLAVNNIHVSIIYSFSLISIGLLNLIPIQSRICSFKAFRHFFAFFAL